MRVSVGITHLGSRVPYPTGWTRGTVPQSVEVRFKEGAGTREFH